MKSAECGKTQMLCFHHVHDCSEIGFVCTSSPVPPVHLPCWDGAERRHDVQPNSSVHFTPTSVEGGLYSPLTTHSERSSPFQVRTHSLSSCQGWKRAAYSSDAARWRFGRKKGHRPIGPIAGGIAWGKTPGERVRCDCGLPLGSGRLSHGVKARSAIGIELPWLLEHRLLSEAKGNHCADYLSS
jgi:hypothetical protein